MCCFHGETGRVPRRLNLEKRVGGGLKQDDNVSFKWRGKWGGNLR